MQRGLEVCHHLLGIGGEPNDKQGWHKPVKRIAPYERVGFAKTDALRGQPLSESPPFYQPLARQNEAIHAGHAFINGCGRVEAVSSKHDPSSDYRQKSNKHRQCPHRFW